MSAQGTLAVRGTGSIGTRHITVLRDLLQLKPVAVPVRAERLTELKGKGFQVAAALERVSGPGPHACVVATSTERHLPDAQDALRKGFSVLIEKPLSHSSEGLRQLKDLADATGLKVFVGCNLRFHRGLCRFRGQLPKLGPVHSVRIECQSYLPDWHPDSDYRRSYSARKNTGGVLLDLIHEIDYAMWLFGRPEKVFAKLQHSGTLEIESEDTADLLWTAPHAAAVSIRLDYITRRTRRRMTAIGSNGTLEWDAIGQTVRWVSNAGEEEVVRIEQKRDTMYRDQAEAFLRALSGGSPGDLATLEEGADAVAVCDAARRSSASGREEPIRDWRAD